MREVQVRGESRLSTLEKVARNVKRWGEGEQALRWTAPGGLMVYGFMGAGTHLLDNAATVLQDRPVQ